MSILDTFFILFEADTTKLQKGLKQVNKESKDTADIVNTKVNTAFKDLATTIAGAVVATISLSSVIKNMEKGASFSNAIGRMSDSIGLGIKDMSAWGEAVTTAGGSAASFQGTIMGMTNDLQQVALTGQSSMMPFLSRMGISMFNNNGHIKSAISLLPQIAQQFSKMSKVQSMTFGKRLGLDTGTIMLLQKGKKAVLEQINAFKSMDAVSKKNAKISEEFTQSLQKSKIALRGVFLQINNAILPALTWFNNAMSGLFKFLSSHKTLATGFFIAIGTAITYFLLPPLISAATAVLVAVAPFLLLGAIIGIVSTAFALLYEDINNFLDGNNSLIGLIVQKYPVVGEIIKGIIKVIKELWEIVKEVFSEMAEVIEHPLQVLDALENKLLSIKDKMSNFLGDTEKEISVKFHTGMDKIKSFFGGEDIKKAKAVVNNSNALPINNNSILNTDNDSTTTNSISINKIEIHTQATDADGISASIKENLTDHIRTAVANFDDGVEK